MWKLTKTILVLSLALMAGGAFADEWSPIGLEWGFGWLPQENTNVYGLRLGLMRGNHTVRGVGISVADVSDLFSSGRTSVTGVNIALAGSTISTEHFAFLVGGAGDDVQVKSGGIVQICGLGCSATDGFAVSIAPVATLHEGTTGGQIGGVNFSELGGGGLQIGVCNYARGGWSGLQIGLVNYIEGSWILPLVNWRF